MAQPDPVVIRPLRLLDIPRAVQLSEAALDDDPLQIYIRDTPDARHGEFNRVWRLQVAGELAARIHKDQAWTIGNADGVVACVPPDDIGDDIDKLIEILLPTMSRAATGTLSPQQQRRHKEFGSKIRAVLQKTLGNRAKDMVYLSALATDPPKQGHGYGSALVRQVTAQADAHRRATWLLSSNTANTEFYEFNGFFTVGEVVVGNDDPTWQGPPVIVPLMVREMPGPRA